MKYWFAVEGNIGSGKSEFMEMLHNVFNDKVSCRKEPQYKWKCTQHSKECSSNLLDLFYSDTKRWAYTFQTRCVVSRIMDYKRTTKQITFCERSWVSDKYVQAKTLVDLNLMSTFEYELFEEFYDWTTKSASQISGYIYLKKSPETCFENVKNEVGIQLTYIKHLHNAYEDMFLNKTFQDIPILIINMDKSYTKEEYKTMLITSFPILNNYIVKECL